MLPDIGAGPTTFGGSPLHCPQVAELDEDPAAADPFNSVIVESPPVGAAALLGAGAPPQVRPGAGAWPGGAGVSPQVRPGAAEFLGAGASPHVRPGAVELLGAGESPHVRPGAAALLGAGESPQVAAGPC